MHLDSTIQKLNLNMGSLDFFFSLNQIHDSRQYTIYNQKREPYTFSNFFQLLLEESPASEQFVKEMTDQMKSFPANGYFIEMPPIAYNTYMTQPFEFMLIPSHELSQLTPDYSPFEKKFKRICSDLVTTSSSKSSEIDSAHVNVKTRYYEDYVVSFTNLSGDSTLITPCPIIIDNNIDMASSNNNPSEQTAVDFSHLAKFIQNADLKLIHTLWRRVASEVLQILSDDNNSNSSNANHHHQNENRKLWISTSGLGVSWLHVRLDNRPKYYNWEEYKFK